MNPQHKQQPQSPPIPIEQILKPLGEVFEKNEAAQVERHKEMSGLLVRIASALEALTQGQGSLEEVAVALEIAVSKKSLQRIIDVIKQGFGVTQEDIDAVLPPKNL